LRECERRDVRVEIRAVDARLTESKSVIDQHFLGGGDRKILFDQWLNLGPGRIDEIGTFSRVCTGTFNLFEDPRDVADNFIGV